MAHRRYVIDTDPHFLIDPISRSIIDQSYAGTFLMQHDHNSQRLTFEMPREVDKHDMSTCDSVTVHYVNIGNNGQRSQDEYKVDDLHIKNAATDTIEFTWLISGTATAYAGSISFVISFICSDENQIEYIWNTALYKDIAVKSGLNVRNSNF